MKSMKYVAATGMLLASVQASAALLDSVGGSTLPIAGQENFFEGDVGAANYDIGADLYFGADAFAMANLTYTFLGKEASWVNVFNAGGGSVSNTAPLGTSFTVGNVDTSANGGLLDFSFATTSPAAVAGSVANGSNSWAPEFAGKSFAVILGTTFKGTYYDALLLWDDAGGGGDDDNHDDMVIGLNVADVPEPGTIALMGLGLLGLGIARRRK